MSAQHCEQLLLRNHFDPHSLQLRHKFLALCQNTTPDVLVGSIAALLQLAQSCLQRHDAKGLRCRSSLIINYPFCRVPFNNVPSQFRSLWTFQSKRLFGENVNKSATTQLFLVKKIGESQPCIYMMCKCDESKLNVLKLDWWVLLYFWCTRELFLFTPFFLVLTFYELGIFAFPLQLFPQIFQHLTQSIVIDPQISFLFVFVAFFCLVQFLIFAQFFQFGLKRVMIQLKLAEGIEDCFVILAESLELLIFLLLLIIGELLCFFEYSIFVLIRHDLNLCFLGLQICVKFFYFFCALIKKFFLLSEFALDKNFIMLQLAHTSLQIFCFYLVVLHEFVFDFLVLIWKRSNYCLQTNGFLHQIFFLHAGLLKHAHMRQLLQLFYFLLRSKVQFVQFLDLLLEDIDVNWLPLPLSLLAY